MSSIDSASGVGFEELLGVLAVTTFLVGFSTVRVQSSLQEWREQGERIVNRLLEQNAGQDLLPLPNTLHTLTGTNRKLKVDLVTWLTQFATALSFISFVLIWNELDSHGSKFETSLLTWLSGLAGAILFIGVIDILMVKFKVSREARVTPAHLFTQLEHDLLLWAQHPNVRRWDTSMRIARRCQLFEEVIPDWCWISLIRYDLLHQYQSMTRSVERNDSEKLESIPVTIGGADVALLPRWIYRLLRLGREPTSFEIDSTLNLEMLRPAVERIRRQARQSKDDDNHSLIAFVWSTLLLDDNALEQIASEEIEKVARYRQVTDDTFAELTVRCADRVARLQGHPNIESLRAMVEAIPIYARRSWCQQFMRVIVSRTRIVEHGSRSAR